MSSPLKGGKTPPRLIDDLCSYNPTRLPNSRYNILTELALPYVENVASAKTTGKGACRHKWMLKPRQSSAVLLDNNTQPGGYNLAAFCSECRTHLLLNLEIKSTDGHAASPCPNSEGRLHHFRHVPEQSPGLQVSGQNAKTDDWQDTQIFHCSIKTCSARLLIQLRSPRLRRDWCDLLANRTAIARRARDAIEAYPDRLQGHPVPTPTTVLDTLKKYINNATIGEGKMIAGDNKRFVLTLGDPCAEVLQALGFRRQEDGWDSPQPNPMNDSPLSSPLNILLDDVDKELNAMILKQPEDDRRIARVDASLAPAVKIIEPLLGYKNYATDPANRAVDLTMDEHPYYAGLGSVGDFHDDLISFAYEQQCATDKANVPYYVQCFRGIAEGRGSPDLQFKAAVDASKGQKTLAEIRKAYKTFGLDPNDGLLDDTIIGTFQSRLADSCRQEPELREDLKVIGMHRESDKIQQVADNKINTYEEALEWLGFAKDEIPADDSFITSMYQVKLTQNADIEIGRKCVSIIAEERNSTALREFLRTGELGDTEMDSAQAYVRLDINPSVDDETVKVAYDALASEAPATQVLDLRKALVAIAKDRNSTYLQSCVGSSMPNGDHHDLAEWPVGLENIGNTCYLNSLLQFYFTIRPLRELVLHFEEHKMEVDSGDFARKQVGSRQVSKKEVQRAQRFVYELRRLFQDMISSDRPQVVPEQELARLTLLSSSTEEIFRRRSTLQSPRPALGEIDGRLVHGPLPPPIPESTKEGPESAATVQEAPEKPATEAEREPVIDDTSSDGTLVEKPQSPEDTDLMIVDSPTEIQQQQQLQVLEDKENLAPSKEEDARPGTPDAKLKPLGETSPSRINEQRSPPKNTSPVKADFSAEPPSRIPGPPNRPPPVPPRDAKPANKEEIQRELEFGAQQDVTEAISNVLFQLSCAIKGAGVDGDGEQIDTIKQLFFGKQKTVTTDKDGVARTKEELFSDVKVQVVDGPRDLYQALDAAFDEEEVDVGTGRERQYTTVSVLPPILQIHVARAQYDKEKASLFKSNHHLAFPEVLFMDRYVDAPDDPDLQQRRAECWGWKRELARLEKQAATLQTTSLGIDMPDALRSMAAYLDQLTPAALAAPAPRINAIDALAGTVPIPAPKGSDDDDNDDDDDDAVSVPPTLARRLETASASAAAARAQLDQRTAALRAQIASQFADRRARPYRLHAVFIHRGLATSGHYWIYIHDFARARWRRYNDGYVSAVAEPAREILETEAGARPATSSFLVYVREGAETELTDAVRRDPPPPPPPLVPSGAGDAGGFGDGLSWAQETGDAGTAADGATDAQGDYVMGDSEEPPRGRPNGVAARTEPFPAIGALEDEETARLREQHSHVRW